MSSGFSNKNQEATYNRSVAHLLQLVQTHLLKYLNGDPLDVICWTKNFTKVYQSVQNLEKHKRTHPKFSVYCAQLADYFGVYSDNPHSESTTSLKHDLDLTFIHDTRFQRRKTFKRNAGNSNQSYSHFKLSERPSKLSGKPSKLSEKPSKLSERPSPRIQRYNNYTPVVTRFKSHPIAQNKRHTSRKRKDGQAYQIYQNRAMWKLNNDLMIRN